MVREDSHLDQVERWARFIRDNPDSWKEEHKKFIDAQFTKSMEFYEELEKTEEGRKKIVLLKNTKI